MVDRVWLLGCVVRDRLAIESSWNLDGNTCVVTSVHHSLLVFLGLVSRTRDYNPLYKS